MKNIMKKIKNNALIYKYKNNKKLKKTKNRLNLIKKASKKRQKENKRKCDQDVHFFLLVIFQNFYIIII